MRRFIVLTLTVIAGALFAAGAATPAPSPNACNQGTEMAHSKIPEGVPGHHHVPECE